MNTLVTGCTGFLGRPLLELLRRPSLTSLEPGPGVIVCDLADPASAERLIRRTRPRLVFHLAGSAASSRLSADAFWRCHVTSTANLLDALSTHAPGARVVVAGSSAEYGVVRDSPVGEDCPTDPVNDYGSSKLAQTLLALSYRHQGLDVRVARIFNAMGPGMPESLALGSFARQIADIEEGRQPPKILVGNLSSSRDYVDARDVARALLLLSRRGRSGGIYNVCSGRVQRMDALLRQLLSLASKSISVVRDPGRIRRGEVSRIFGSPAKLRRDTGWTPQIPLPQSLRDTLRWHLRP